jgi:hypothetical protein
MTSAPAPCYYLSVTVYVLVAACTAVIVCMMVFPTSWACFGDNCLKSSSDAGCYIYLELVSLERAVSYLLDLFMTQHGRPNLYTNSEAFG